MRRSFMHQLLDSSQTSSYDFSLFSIVVLSFLNDQMMKNQKFSKKMMILQRFFTFDESIIHSNQKMSFANSSFLIESSIKLNVIMISIVIYHSLSKRHHKNKNYEINKILSYVKSRLSIKFMIEVNETFTQKFTFEKMNRLLLVKFKNLLQDFDLNLIEQFSSHKIYDHKIELEKNFRTIKSQMYSMFYHKLLKSKKYFDENFKKDFITISLTFFVFSILFVTKFNDSF